MAKFNSLKKGITANISQVKGSFSTPTSMTSVQVLFLVNGNISSRT